MSAHSRRYDRQILLPHFGQAGQEILSRARVTIVGVGGLGSAAAHYLAAAGIGTIRVIDRDTVEETNLNRQILHHQNDIGRQKTESAGEKLGGFNPLITIERYAEPLDTQTVERLVSGSDIIVDCLDNFPTRFILDDWCFTSGTPLVHGACRGWEGRVITLVPGITPCLHCLIPATPAPETVPIIGVTAGIIGTMQAGEVIKHLLGFPRRLTGIWLLYDGETLTSRLIHTDELERCSRCQVRLPAE